MRRLLILALLLTAGPVFAQSHPVFFQRASDLARFTAMKANYDANPSAPTLLGGLIYKRLKTDADSGARYMDFGQLGGYMYAFTCAAGACDSTYVTKAWTQLTTAGHSGSNFINLASTCAALSGNYMREFGWQLVLLYDQIYPGLTAPQRTLFLDQLNAMMSCVSAVGGPAGGTNFRANDTDQTGGEYFLAAMLELSTGSYNTTGHGYWGDSTRKIGGYTATAADGTTRRNSVKAILTDFAEGGEWPESGEYNIGTEKIYLLAAEAIRSVQTPTDNYPEITAWAQDAAEQFMHDIAPGITNTSATYQWGDAQDVRKLDPYYRWETCLVLAGVTTGTSIGPKIQDFCLDWLEAAGGGSTGLALIDPWPRGFLMFDPTVTRGDHTTGAKSKYVAGEGIYSGRTGWAASDTAFWAQMPRFVSYDRPNGANPIDHFAPVWGEFQMLKAGQFAITHPITYGGPSLDGRGSNGLTLGGVPTITGTYGPRLRGVQAHEDDDANGFLYITGTQGGSIVPSAYYGMPTNFIMEHTRSIVWLKGFDTVIVHDRANAKAPSSGWGGALQTWIDSRPRKELYIHSPVSPTQGSGYLDWAYSGSNHTRVNLLLPPSPGIAVENEATVWVSGYYGLGTVAATEKKYHTIITPSDQGTQFHTFLNVWDAYAAGTPGTVTLVQDASNKVDCALVTKGSDNRLACFNAVQGQDLPERTLVSNFGYYAAGTQTVLDSVRKRTTSYTVTFTVPGGSSTTKALLFDLDTNKTWTSNVNGAGAVTLTPDSQGVGVVDISGTGSKTLAIETTGTADLVITTTSPLPNGTQNVAYNFCFVATGGLAPYTWSKTGSLPTGLTLDADTGCATGTPTGTGASSWSTTVTDSQGSPDTATLNPTALTIDAASTPTVITTTSLAAPVVNAAYTATICATGGTGTYDWTISGGALPTGVTLSDATDSICATLTGPAIVADQSATFTVQACDNAGSPVCDDQDFSQRVQFTNGTSTQLTVVGIAATSIYGYYGAPGLAADTSCTISMSGQSDQTTTSGGSRRDFVFSGLTASTSYDLTASCVGLAFPTGRTVTTKAVTSAKTIKFSLKPKTSLGADTLELYVDTSAANVATALSGGTYTTRSTSCSTGCTLSTSVAQGVMYRAWIWRNGSTEVARSATQPFIVE